MTTPDHDSAADTENDAQRVVYALLIAGTIAVAAVTFVISFVGLRDYGIRVMGVPTVLAPLVPIGVDVFSLCGIAATYLLARAAWRVRVYAWAVFLVPAALSIAGNLAHADVRHLANAGKAGVAAAPVVLALAAHLLVVIRRHLRHDRAHVTQRDLPQQDTSPQPSRDETLSSGRPDEPVRRRPANATPDESKALALRLLDEGADFAEAASEVGVSKRTVQRWFDERVEEIKTRSRTRRTTRQPGQATADEPVSTPRSDADVADVDLAEAIR